VLGIRKFSTNILDWVNRRDQFGELRIDRLITVYRLRYFSTHAVRGYLYGYKPYTPFFEKNLS
jgi:hypothetical protein